MNGPILRPGRHGSMRIGMEVGPFRYAIHTSLPAIMDVLDGLYGDARRCEPDEWCDFHLAIVPRRVGWRRWRWSADILTDGMVRFRGLEPGAWVAYLEWGMNSCLARDTGRYVLLHASSVASPEGRGVIFLGPAGCGKSSLSAWLLAHHGWRLLSDEFAVIDLTDPAGGLLALERPLCLKNAQLDRFAAAIGTRGVFGPEGYAPRKGRIRHWMAPPALRQPVSERVQVAHIVLPCRDDDAARSATLAPVSRGEAMRRAIAGSFNYHRLGEPGFRALAGVLDRCDCHTLAYGDAEEGAAALVRELP